MKALSPRSDVAGVVLAGGLGRRMGRDKTGLRLREGEADFISRAAALLARVVVDVRVGCRADQAERAARAGRPLTPDLTPGGGVLCAVQSCLRHLERPCLVIPCDMPFLTEGVLLALLAARDEGLAAGCPPGVTLFRRAETGRLEPMWPCTSPPGCRFWTRPRPGAITACSGRCRPSGVFIWIMTKRTIGCFITSIRPPIWRRPAARVCLKKKAALRGAGRAA